MSKKKNKKKVVKKRKAKALTGTSISAHMKKKEGPSIMVQARIDETLVTEVKKILKKQKAFMKTFITASMESFLKEHKPGNKIEETK